MRSKYDKRTIYTSISWCMSTWKILNEEKYEYQGPIASCDAPLAVAIIGLVISLAIQAYMILTAEEPPQLEQEERGVKTNTRSTQEPLRLVYGTQRIGGNDVYGTTLDKHNKTLYLVQSLSEGECEGIENDPEGNPYIFIDDKQRHEFNSYENRIKYRFYSGTGTQDVDSSLNSADPTWTDPLRHTSYIRWRFRWDENQFRGVPKREIILKGIKVVDFRNSIDSTAEFSANPVLCLFDYMTNKSYGLGLDSSKINLTTWTTAANYCDAKGWECNISIKRDSRNAWSIVDDILQLFRGSVSWFDGKYYLYFADLNEESSVFTITDEHIYQDESGKAEIRLNQTTKFNKPNGIRVKFIDKEKQYTADDLVIGDNVGVVEQIELLGCTDRKHASDIGTYRLERMRLNRTISGTFRDDCLLLEPHDVVTLNSTAVAQEDQLMRVIESTFTENGLINLTLQFESEELYDDDYDVDIEGVYKVTLPDPSDIQPISNAQVEEEVYVNRLRTFSRLNITFDVDSEDAWFSHVEVHISTNGDVSANYIHQFNANTNFSIDPAEEGKTYWIKLRTVNLFGAKEDLDDLTKLMKKVEGKTSTYPQSPNPLDLVPGDNALSLESTKLSNPDIEVYEFRLGSQWLGGIFLASLRSPNYSIKNIKPGLFSFSLNTKGTNGLYGEYPVSASTTIPSPKGWNDAYSFFDDYSDSTSSNQLFDNTEQVNYSGEDYLKCSHSTDATSSIVLTGKYTSPIFDVGVGNDDFFFTYVDTEFVTIGQGTTWAEVFGDSTSVTDIWSDQGVVTRSWGDVLQIDEAPQVSITIYFKKNIGDDWSSIPRAEISAAVVEARYFYVEISISDPAESINAYIKGYTLYLLN